jgi:2-polyprenyl-3-methyl-5-hydroxy-6-metoxy-1,4-benzoquinol methylase
MDKTIYDTYYHLEREHWWFQARQEIVLSFLERYCPQFRKGRILDIGAGTGSFLEVLGQQGVDIEGHDASNEAIKYLKTKTQAKVQQKSFPEDYSQEVSDQYDVIFLLDVLEHLKDDQAGMNEALRLIKPAGILICTVPAIKSMWSPYDVVSHHYRRYQSKELKSIVSVAAGEIKKISYFSTFLFLLLYSVRVTENLISKVTKKIFYNPHVVSEPFNHILFSIARLEKHLLKRISFPIGSSLIMVVEKK